MYKLVEPGRQTNQLQIALTTKPPKSACLPENLLHQNETCFKHGFTSRLDHRGHRSHRIQNPRHTPRSWLSSPSLSRKLSSAEKLKDLPSIKPYAESLEFIEVPDMLAEGAFDSAVQGVEYILHLASPSPTTPTPATSTSTNCTSNPQSKAHSAC